jgi:hypothetical protein
MGGVNRLGLLCEYKIVGYQITTPLFAFLHWGLEAKAILSTRPPHSTTPAWRWIAGFLTCKLRHCLIIRTEECVSTFIWQECRPIPSCPPLYKPFQTLTLLLSITFSATVLPFSRICLHIFLDVLSITLAYSQYHEFSILVLPAWSGSLLCRGDF